MSFDARTLYELLPAIYRIRDGERGEPLRALPAVLAEQAQVLEENLEQLYDDQFIETCADWVTPYIGGLIGYRTLHGVAPAISSPRADVANTIGFRRRKGTATMLEEMARDVTGWPARVVEFFQLLPATQYMNHIRPEARFTPDLRAWEPLERLGTAFDSIAHTVDVRHIAKGSGRYQIPNVGIFLWRLQACPLDDSPAVKVDDRRYRFSPLGNDIPLFTRPAPETGITHLAEPINVPAAISRRVLQTYLGSYYGLGQDDEKRSLVVKIDGAALAPDEVKVCDLSDVGGGAWAHQPTDKAAIDPVLGRLAFPGDHPAGVSVSFHYGFGADLGGGQYERAARFAEPQAGQLLLKVPSPGLATIEAALAALPTAGGIVEITDNGRYEETPAIGVGAGGSVELRAANGRRPILLLGGDLEITGGADASVTLDGLVLAGGAVRVPDAPANQLRQLALRHCTLVPGGALEPEGAPVAPGEPSLIVERVDLELVAEACILGGLRIVVGATTSLTGSVLDATGPAEVAYAAPDGAGALDPGGALSLADCTVFGRISTEALRLVSNSILFAEAPAGAAPVRSVRKQEGCVRFSFVPRGSIVPRRFRCQPDLQIANEIERRQKAQGGPLGAAQQSEIATTVAAWLVPTFTARRYGHPGYAQLGRSCPAQIRRGADDEAEMGVLHTLYQPQRETNLKVRLEEYLRFGLEAGLFYET